MISCSASLSETMGRLEEVDIELQEAKITLVDQKTLIYNSSQQVVHDNYIIECKDKIKNLQKNKDSLDDRVLGLRERVMSASEVV